MAWTTTGFVVRQGSGQISDPRYELYIGTNDREGAATLSDGAEYNPGEGARVGWGGGNVASLTVEGAGSRFVVGLDPHSLLDVGASADFFETIATGTALIRDGGEIAVLSQGANASFYAEADVDIGEENAIGRMTIETGGALTVRGAEGLAALNIGLDAGGVGVLTASGVGTTITLEAMTDGPYAWSTVTVGRDGGDGDLTVDGGARLDMASAGEEAGLNVGYDDGVGRVVVDGEGSAIAVTTSRAESESYMNVGRTRDEATGDGSFTISGGADVSFLSDGYGSYLNIGRGTGSVGVVTVTGDGSTLSLTGGPDGSGASAWINVGRDGGTGTLTVADGADVLLDNGGDDGGALPGLVVGRDDGSVGAFTVDGRGTTVTVQGVDQIVGERPGESGQIVIAKYGQATAVFSNGARVENAGEGAIASIARNDESAGDLTVRDGAFFDAGDIFSIGAEIDWEDLTDPAFDFTQGGDAELTILHGAEVEARRTGVGADGQLDGTGLLDSDATFLNGGRIAPGAANGAGVGTLTIDGDLTAAAGVIDLDLSGFADGAFDLLAVSGAVDIAAAVSIQIDAVDFDAAGLADGDSVALLRASDLSLDASQVVLNGFDAIEGVRVEATVQGDALLLTADVDRGAVPLPVSQSPGQPIRGDNGSNRMIGDDDDDVFLGGGGRDRLDGGGGDDRLGGGSGADRLMGGAGDDRLDGGVGGDRLFGGFDDDTLLGGGGDDRLMGQAGDDALRGQNDDDALRGGGGADNLDGGRGDDALFGNAGADTLDGGKGRDALVGGGGADLFQFSAKFGRDTIRDFQDGRDSISFAFDVAFEDLAFSQRGDDARIATTGGRIDLLDVDVAALTEDDFVFG